MVLVWKSIVNSLSVTTSQLLEVAKQGAVLGFALGQFLINFLGFRLPPFYNLSYGKVYFDDGCKTTPLTND